MKILMAASECAPFVKTGGLADVVGALPHALEGLGLEVRILLPAYRMLLPLLTEGREVARFDDLPGGPGRLVDVSARGIRLLLLDAPQLFDRAGGPYVDADGRDWPDNALRFGAVAQTAALVAQGAVDGFRPDILHAHDWQTALAPVYLRMAGEARPKSVLTIHNIAFQGRFSPTLIPSLQLDAGWFHPEGFEFHGDLSFLKGGLVYSDRITTVSPTYAREILTPHFGMGLEGVLQARREALTGLLNGIDTHAWDPSDDADLAQSYTSRTLSRRAANKAEICKRFGLQQDAGAPLFCVISRLTEQKGLDALLEAVPDMVARGAMLAVLGSGDRRLEAGFRAVADRFPSQVGVVIGYDEALAHLLQGGSDAILIPSRFEPCGLTQLYGLRYGTLPVVARTGGLADTVIDANPAAIAAGAATGFVFDDLSLAGVSGVVDRVLAAYSDAKLWQTMQRAAMRHPVGWDMSARAYRDLYASLAE